MRSERHARSSALPFGHVGITHTYRAIWAVVRADGLPSRSRSAALSVIVLLAGCTHGKSGAANAPVRTVRRRIVVTTTAKSGGPIVYSSTTSGVFDFTTGDAQFTSSVPVSNPPSGEAAPHTTLYVAGHAYVAIDTATAAHIAANLRRGKHWIVSSRPSDNGLPDLGNPFTVIAYLRRQAVSVRNLGPPRVDSQTVQHERSIVPLP